MSTTSGGDAEPDSGSSSSFEFADDRAVEEKRLEALYRYDTLDTDPQKVFDEIAEVAASLFDAPIAMVSLIDEDRQWFKACVGMDRRESDLDASICIYTIQSEGVTIIPDATKDDRFADTELVTGPPGIRFYAGAPLQTSDDLHIGTLCIIDQEPRSGITDAQRRHLQRLADVVVDELELRREIEVRAQREEELEEARRAAEEVRRTAERERKAAEEARAEAEAARAEAEEANAAMARFFAGIAHDLQTPITRIQLFADLLKRSLADETNRYIQKIHASSEHMSSMVQSLQDLAQVRSGEMMLDPEPTDVSEIVASACQVAETDADETKRTLNLHLPDHPVRALVDADALRRIVDNLIGNALQYTRTGDRIDVSVRDAPESPAGASDSSTGGGTGDASSDATPPVRIEITDTGPGIDDETLETLFEPFTRGDGSDSPGNEGMGLGLAVSKDLAIAMNGNLTVDSQKGKGTTFEVTVPAVRD